MNGFMAVAAINDLRDGEMKMVNVAGQAVLLARVDGKYYAVDNTCPHMGGSLSQGRLEGTVVTCPRHHSRFDLRDGRVVQWTDWTGFKLSMAKMFKPPRSLKTYEVKTEGDSVLVATSKAPAAVA